MKIAILSRDSSLYSTRRLKEAGINRGHEVAIIDYLRCYMNITSRNPQVIYQGNPLEGVDAVIPPSQTRSYVARALRALRTKRQTLPPKKHGNIPL